MRTVEKTNKGKKMKNNKLRKLTTLGLISGVVLMFSSLNAYAADNKGFAVSGRVLAAACALTVNGDFALGSFSIPGVQDSNYFDTIFAAKTAAVTMRCSGAIKTSLNIRSDYGNSYIAAKVSAFYYINNVKGDGAFVPYTYVFNGGAEAYAANGRGLENLVSQTGKAGQLNINKTAIEHTLSRVTSFDVIVNIKKVDSGVVRAGVVNDTLIVEVNYI